MGKVGYVYLTASRPNGVVYVGVTSNLVQRIHQHKIKFYPKSFTARYNADQLVYFEEFSSIVDAIAREKQVKAGSRKKKVALIEKDNPRWRDLYEDLIG